MICTEETIALRDANRKLMPTLFMVATLSVVLWCTFGGLPFARLADAGDAASRTQTADEADPLGANAACYVCHMTFVREELAKTHLKEKIGCPGCHGLSQQHANDENVGATKPDIVFHRSQVDKSCGECHKQHNASAKAVIGRFVERGSRCAAAPICTDCHGTHKIERSALPALLSDQGSAKNDRRDR